MRSIILFPLMLGAASLANATPQEPVAPQAPSTEQRTAETETKPAEGKKICRREPVTGSNKREKICMTEEQWKRWEDS